jgi:hypothetical protein
MACHAAWRPQEGHAMFISKAGATSILDPGALNLREREGESIHVEARK